MKRSTVLLLFLLTSANAPATAAEPASRPAAPNAAAVQKAAGEVDRTFHDALIKARDAEAKGPIAEKVFKLSAEEKDPATKYALLSKAIDIAVQAGDPDIAAKALKEIETTWQVDGLKLRAKAFTDLSRNARSPEARSEVARQLQTTADDALATRDFTLAKDLNEAATAAARRGNNAALAKQLSGHGAEISRAKAAEARMKPAAAALKANPADPAANATVGKYECFFEGNWPAGLPKLARGADAALKSLAEKDLAAGSDAQARLSAADAWWDLSKREEDPARRHLQLHATELYRKAARDLTGLTKVRVEQRIAEFDKQHADHPDAANTSNIKVVNRTNAREASNILAEVLHGFPDSLKGIEQATLIGYHNGSEFEHAGASTPGPGAYSPGSASAAGNSFLFWGVHQQWQPGKYLVVYRMQALKPPKGEDLCSIDLYSDGDDLAGHDVAADEAPVGKWIAVPLMFTLDKPAKAEYRMYTSKDHTVALDRIYVYQLPQPSN